MNRNEAADLVAKAKQLWGTSFKITNQTVDDWAQHAGGITPKHVHQALDLIAGEGSPYPPSLATLMARARGIQGPVMRTAEDRTSLATCLHCGGPTHSKRNHYSWCFYGDGEFALHESERRTDLPANAQRQNPWKEVTSVPDELRTMLSKVGKHQYKGFGSRG